MDHPTNCNLRSGVYPIIFPFEGSKAVQRYQCIFVPSSLTIVPIYTIAHIRRVIYNGDSCICVEV